MSNIIILDVPFVEKEEAKMLGAKWNPEIRKWYVPKHVSTKAFKKWIQSERTEDSAEPQHKRDREYNQDQR